ncbi:hypothetical protein L7F22_020058 [Adiantum nelumboides]|nr:hypothetical protein [Adiantum nelumboides]
MAASAPVLGTTQDAPRPVTWTYELTEEDETEMRTAIEHFSGHTLVGRLVGTTPLRPTVREWIESALGGSIVRIPELSMMGAGLFLLQLSDSVSIDALLARSPISSVSRLLVFQRWTPQFDQDEFDCQQQIPRFPVTLSFPSLPIFMRQCIPRMVARRHLFNFINDLPTLFDIVTGRKAIKEKSSANNSSKNKGKPDQLSQARPFPKEADEDSEDDEEEDEHSEATCGSCGKRYTADEFWICCDSCERWFHGKCVKVTPARAEHLKQYKCPACSKRART